MEHSRLSRISKKKIFAHSFSLAKLLFSGTEDFIPCTDFHDHRNILFRQFFIFSIDQHLLISRESKAFYQSEIEKVLKIPSIDNILKVFCEFTGLAFAAVTKASEKSWVACATLDKIGFGLATDGELPIETIICNELCIIIRLWQLTM